MTDTSKPEELLPCPFCGWEPKWIDRTPELDPEDIFSRMEGMVWDVRCTNSKCYLSEGAEWFETKMTIAAMWNSRNERA